MTRYFRIAIYALGICLLPAGAVLAGDNTHYDRINLSASAQEEVKSDTIVAVLYAQEEGDTLAPLSDRVNRRIQEAIKKSKAVDGIEVRTLGYTTQPRYQKQRLTGWLVRQSIQLKTRDLDAMGNLLGKLQNDLALQSMGYRVSPQQLDAVKERLIERAIAGFKQRAQSVTRQWGRKDYRLVTMSINDGNPPVMPRSYAVMQDSAMSATMSAPPAIEPGTQTVQVSVSGTIELAVK